MRGRPSISATLFVLLVAVAALVGYGNVPSVVQDCPGYNSWPMVQAIGNRLVCAYSRGIKSETAQAQPLGRAVCTQPVTGSLSCPWTPGGHRAWASRLW